MDNFHELSLPTSWSDHSISSPDMAKGLQQIRDAGVPGLVGSWFTVLLIQGNHGEFCPLQGKRSLCFSDILSNQPCPCSPKESSFELKGEAGTRLPRKKQKMKGSLGSTKCKGWLSKAPSFHKT